ncbi:MAG: hypothetical protein WC584_04550 [Candidatus Pacearchaeota archaeon]
MAYKKYITRGGKTYGPYIYHSRRENGKVITEYHGKKSSKKLLKIFLFIFVAIFILIGLYFVISNFNSFNSTGMASLQLATEYKPNEPVDGVLRLSLLKGELIPEGTGVIVTIDGKEKNYSLNELISDETIDGNYYVETSGISGSGLGYGVQGAKYSYPEVNFKLNVVDVSSETNEETATETEASGSETALNESSASQTNESAQTETQETISENSTSETQESETAPIETPTETTPATTSETTQETQNTETPTENTPASAENTETTQTPETPTETETAPTGITGGIIKFFTGLVSMDFAQEEISGLVDGKVAYGDSIQYKIPKGRIAVLVDGSVSTEGEAIDDSYIEINLDKNFATVSTSYRRTEYGFGQDYVGEEKVYYDINLSRLNLIAKEGEMKIELVYGDSVIVETNSNLAIPEKELNASAQNNSIEIFTLENSSSYDLTEDEIKLLIKKTGTSSVNTTKSEVLNGRFVIRYELGDYWTEFSYDYDGELSKEFLEKVELERKYWLKNLARELSKETSESKNVGDLIVGFDLNESNDFKLKKGNVSEEVEKEVKEKKNETEEAQISEAEQNISENAAEETPAENSSEILGNETEGTNVSNESSTSESNVSATESAQTETPGTSSGTSSRMQNPDNKTSTENVNVVNNSVPVEKTSKEQAIESKNTTEESTSTISGQIVSQSESQTDLFNKIKRFFGKIIRDIRESFG